MPMPPTISDIDATAAAQATFRNGVKAYCQANGYACLDMYDAWAAQGNVGYASANADRPLPTRSA